MDKVINHGMPHIGEQIFESIDTPGLIQCLSVSETWKVLAENVLIKRWKGKMLEACRKGETKVVQLLLESCDNEESGLNIKNICGYTPFMIACLHGHKNVVQLLLDQKNIDLNTKTNRGYTAFMWACENGHTSVVKLLLNHSESNIDLNATTNYFRFTAFILACKYGREDVVKLLLDHSDRIELNKSTHPNTPYVCI